MGYKWCAVPRCENTSFKTPGKLFVSVPRNVKVRQKWLQLSRRDHSEISYSSTIFFCEDHFNIENDMKNYYKYKMGFSQRIILKDKVYPSKFYCQTDHIKEMSDADTSQTAFVKRQKIEIVEQLEDIQQPLLTNNVPTTNVVEACTIGSETESEYETRAPKTSTQRSREYRARKALLKQQSNQQRKPDAIVKIATDDIRSAGPSQDNQGSGCSEIRTIERRAKSVETTQRCSDKKILSKKAQYMRDYRKRKKLSNIKRNKKGLFIRKTSAEEQLQFPTDADDKKLVSKVLTSDLSKELCSETILTLKRKIIEDFNLLEGQDDGILGTNGEVEIQLENPENVEAPLPNLSSASSSLTNPACGNQTTEPHTVWIPVSESQNAMDITTMKEVPGNPLSYVSVPSQKADSQELAIKMELTKKMEMLKENGQILKRLREEIVTFEMKHKVLIADIKYLQNVSKKKRSLELM